MSDQVQVERRRPANGHGVTIAGAGMVAALAAVVSIATVVLGVGGSFRQIDINTRIIDRHDAAIIVLQGTTRDLQGTDQTLLARQEGIQKRQYELIDAMEKHREEVARLDREIASAKAFLDAERDARRRLRDDLEHHRDQDLDHLQHELDAARRALLERVTPPAR